MISFEGRHFPKEIILMSVRWYIASPLIYRQIEELLLECNLKIDHATLNHWAIKYSPELKAKFRKKYKRQPNSSWRVDETYLKVKGENVYLYRAVEKFGKTIDFMLSEKRDKKAAISFFNKAITQHGFPEKITIDGSGTVYNKNNHSQRNQNLQTIKTFGRMNWQRVKKYGRHFQFLQKLLLLFFFSSFSTTVARYCFVTPKNVLF